MKKRGFTLIELLAVIVVLAIIALIATPIVMNVIKNAQKGATERSAERYLDAVEQAIATDRLENGLIADGTYTVDADGNLVLGDKTLTVEVSGDKPAAGSTVTIQNGQVVATGTSMTIGDYTVIINDKGSATATAKEDVVALCTAAGSNLSYEPGTEYSCELGDGVTRTFYVLAEDGNNVKLIMNSNFESTVAWSRDENSVPDTANTYLANQTSGWTKLSQSQITLPDAQDIANVIGVTNWDGRTTFETTLPDWLIINLSSSGRYWTSTVKSDDRYSAWGVTYAGSITARDITKFDGIRPVITIAKTDMSL